MAAGRPTLTCALSPAGHGVAGMHARLLSPKALSLPDTSPTPRHAPLVCWPEPATPAQRHAWLSRAFCCLCRSSQGLPRTRHPARVHTCSHSALALSISLSTLLLAVSLILPWYAWENDAQDGGEGAQWVGGWVWLYEARSCVQRRAGRSKGTPGGFCLAIIAPQLPLAVDYFRVGGAVAGVCLITAILCIMALDRPHPSTQHHSSSQAGYAHDAHHHQQARMSAREGQSEEGEEEGGVTAKGTRCTPRVTIPSLLLCTSLLSTTAICAYPLLISRGLTTDPDSLLGLSGGQPVQQGWGYGIWTAVAGTGMAWVSLLLCTALILTSRPPTSHSSATSPRTFMIVAAQGTGASASGMYGLPQDGEEGEQHL